MLKKLYTPRPFALTKKDKRHMPYRWNNTGPSCARDVLPSKNLGAAVAARRAAARLLCNITHHITETSQKIHT